MIGRTLAHYNIVGSLGAGGMGEVYRAEDTKLGRVVALKVLPAEMASDPERLARFRREAQTAAALNHPNVVTLYSVEEFEGLHFLTMELVDGRPLDRVLAEEGAFARDAFFRVAVPLAAAVAAAHARGIVHRDLKPGNVMLDAEGRARVLDFGLAKQTTASRAGSEDTLSMLTLPGIVLGTVPYMSPEQAQGSEVDERSDVFSLGTMLYELAVGKLPFGGDGLAEVLYAVVHQEPVPVAHAREELACLDPLLRRCLVKRASERTISAIEVRDELERLQRGEQGEITARTPRIASGGAPRRPVIAVLPFASSARDAETREFAEGLASEVVDGVTNTSQAVVLPLSRTRRLGAEGADARSAGEELGAGYVLLGSVRRGGKRLRVSVQLVSVELGAQIWSHRYERDLEDEDLLDAGDEIAARIVSAVSDVHGVIFEVERQRAEGKRIEQLDPWECIFVTLGYDKFIDAEHHELATRALARAVELDSGFALAWGYTSWIATDEYLYGFNQRPGSMERALAAARRAVELDPRSHMLRWLLSRVHFFQGDLEAFLSESKKALELGASDATVIGLVGLYTGLAGDWERGERLMRRAMELNPSSPSYYHMVFGLDRFRQGRHVEALEELRRVGFSNAFVSGLRAATFMRLGRTAEARSARAELERSGETLETLRSLYERWNIRGELLEGLMQSIHAIGAPDG